MPARLRRRVEALARDDRARQLGRVGARREPWTRLSSPRSRWPAGTPSGSASATPRPTARQTAPARRTAPAGLARPPLVPGRLRPRPARTGAASGWTGCSRPAGTGARFRPRELPADGRRRLRPGRHRAAAWAGYEVEVLVDAPAAVVRERIGRWATVETRRGDRCRVRMTADSLTGRSWRWATVGADFQVVSPPELVDQVRDWGGRFSRAARALRALAAAAGPARPRPGSPWPLARE